MAATAWAMYNETMAQSLSNNGQDFDTDSFSIGLYQSISNASDLTQTVVTSLTNQVVLGNGYAPIVLGGITLSRATNVHTWAVGTQVVWTAAGGSIPSIYYAVIFNSNNNLVAYSLLDDTPAAITITDTNTLTINVGSVFILTV